MNAVVCLDEAQINILITGVVGSGKSAACNFFLEEDAFKSEISFDPVTTEIGFQVKMVGGKLTTFVDTPGLLDPYAQTDLDMERLAEAILYVPNGIHALGVVIDITQRMHAGTKRMIDQLLAYTELIPYTFLIFSHAYIFGLKHEEQLQNFKSFMNDTGSKTRILHKLLQNINNRCLVLESVLTREDKSYCDAKRNELTKIIDSILDQQKKPFICFLNDIARELLKKNITQKERIAILAKDLQKTRDQCDAMENELTSTKDQLAAKENELTNTKDQHDAEKCAKEEEMSKMKADLFWRNLVATIVGGGAGALIGAGVGAVASPAGSIVASSTGAVLGTNAVATILGAVAGNATVASTANKCTIQ